MLLILRRCRRAAVSIILALVTGCVLLFALEVGEEYTEASRVEVSWGQGDGQVPVALSKGGSLFGVRAFGCGLDGSVYVVDSARGRVLRFTRAGELQGVLETGRARMAVDDVCVIEDGTVLLADNSSVAVIAVASERPPVVLWNGKGEPAPVRVIESIRAGGAGSAFVVYSTWSKERYVRTLSAIRQGSPEQKVVEFVVTSPGETAQGSVTGLWAPARGGYYAQVHEGDPFTRTIRRVGPGGDVRTEYVVNADRVLQSVTVLGDDRRGRLYAGVDLGTPEGRVMVFDGRGRMVAVVPAPYSGKHKSSTYARVDDAGNIYLLESGEHSAWIRRLEARRRWSVGVRGRS
ncbi:MAG: hypothetical protein HPY55_10255 [Firmicutes bacterium]|nr:hypothetical protein [Bacillota bacterium]